MSASLPYLLVTQAMHRFWAKLKKTLELKLHEKHQNQTIYSLYLILWDKIISLPLKQTVPYDIIHFMDFTRLTLFYNECQECKTFLEHRRVSD